MSILWIPTGSTVLSSAVPKGYNGNTLITEGSGGRIIEVSPDHELVWEYISPYWGSQLG